MGPRLHTRQLVSLLATFAGLALVLGGCGESEEHLKPDEGVSPFHTGKADAADGSNPVRPVTKLGGQDQKASSPATGTTLAGAQPGQGASNLSPSSPPDQFSFEDLDKLNKTGMALGEKGAFAEAAKAFDEVLGAEPQNRQALLGRASVGIDLLPGLSEQDRVTEIGRAAELMRTLKKTYKTLLPRESMAYGIILYNEASVLGNAGQTEKCLDVLEEAVDVGFKKWDMMEFSPSLKSVRNDPRYLKLIAQMKGAALKKAREGAKRRMDQNVGFPFKFRLKDPDGRVIDSADFKGKVLLVDFWGTWCGPCISAIPGLVELHRKYADRGLAIVGIAYEQTSQEEAKSRVKQFVEANKIPYPSAIGDDETQAQVPNFSGYPTTLVLDGSGKVRLFSFGAQQGEAEAMEDVVLMLLEDLKPQAAAASPKKP